MIKNIIFDIDGVLANLDRCYFDFLRDTYKEFKNISYEDLPVFFPIDPNDGSIELPSKFFEDFCRSSHYCNRPLFEDTITVLDSLMKKGVNLYALVAARDASKKLKWLERVFKNIFKGFEFSPSGIPKTRMLRDFLKKYSLDKDETLFVDDRFFNIRAGISIGLHTVRVQPDHYLPLPCDLQDIKTFDNLTDFEKYVDELNAASQIA